MPPLTATRPRPRCSGAMLRALLNAPRTLNDPVFWKSSSFRKTGAPSRAPRVALESRGVLATRPAIHDRYIEPQLVPPLDAGASELVRIAWHVGLLTHVIGDALDRHPEWHLFTHEDLCVEPPRSIREVFDSVRVPWSPDVERFLEETNRPGEGLEPIRVTSEQPDRWRGRLTADEAAEIDRVLEAFPRRGWLRTPAAGGRA